MDKIQTLLSQISLLSKKNNEILEIMGTRFNIFHILGVSHYENTHSTILAELLNPEGTHGLHNSFLKLFLDINQIEGFDSRNALVRTEVAVSEYGRIDILVNNAGISDSTKIDDYTAEQFTKVMDLNVKAIFNAILPTVKIMKEQGGGCIINTSSMVSISGQPSGVAYPTSKTAVNGLTWSLARELGPSNIRVNAVAPGITKTDMVAALPEQVIAPLIKMIPLRRVGEPEDVANAFLYLASDLASYVTGEILSVDGAMRS